MIGEPMPLGDAYEVVIVAEDENGEIVVLGDEEYPHEEAVYLSRGHDRDLEIHELVDAMREVYGPSARAMRTEELDVLSQARDVVNACEAEMDLAGLPDELAEWADVAKFTEDD